MALNSYQKITRIKPNNPFGDGSDGSLTISSNTTQSVSNQSCSGSSGQKDLTIASGDFADGDLVIIHQSRGGSDAGNWEINEVASGGGTTTLTMTENLQNTYTDSGNQQAQVYELKEYSSITVQNGNTWSAPDWGGNTGGILLAACSGTIDISGTVNLKGKGYRGGANGDGNSTVNDATQGEGKGGTGSEANTANHEGGGGGGTEASGNSGSGGGGGGNATAGKDGVDGGSGTNDVAGAGGGIGRSTTGLTVVHFGGGGGGGNNDTDPGTDGGDGSGIAFLIGKTITITGTIDADGEDAALASENGEGGGGAGGAVLFQGQDITLGSSLVTANGSPQGYPLDTRGDGGDGFITAYYGDSISGTTSPTANTEVDSDFVSSLGGNPMFFGGGGVAVG